MEHQWKVECVKTTKNCIASVSTIGALLGPIHEPIFVMTDSVSHVDKTQSLHWGNVLSAGARLIRHVMEKIWICNAKPSLGIHVLLFQVTKNTTAQISNWIGTCSCHSYQHCKISNGVIKVTVATWHCWNLSVYSSANVLCRKFRQQGECFWFFYFIVTLLTPLLW